VVAYPLKMVSGGQPRRFDSWFGVGESLVNDSYQWNYSALARAFGTLDGRML